MNKFLIRSIIVIIFLSYFGFSEFFVKRTINVYINDISSDKSSVIENFYFKKNLSYEEKKKYLNASFLIKNVALAMHPIGTIETNLLGENLNILEVKYSTKPFKFLQKQGRFIKKVIDSYSFNSEFRNNDSLKIDNKTILKFYILKDIVLKETNNKFIIPENIKEVSDVHLSSDGAYLVYEFDGPINIQDFKIIKEYMEPILYFDQNSIWNPFYTLSILIIFMLIIIYSKEILFFTKKVFK